MGGVPIENLTPPLFVWEGDDVMAFGTVDALERELEAEDVESGAYKSAYDASGRIYNLRVVPHRVPIAFGLKSTIRRVTVTPAEGAPLQFEALATKLRSYALRVSLSGMAQEEIQALPADRLVTLVAEATLVA